MKFLTIVMYHYVREIKNSHLPNLKGLEFKEFKNQINYLNSKYNIVDYYQLRDFILNKKKLPKNPCMLTFDDGYKDHIDYVLPELLKRKISGFFFPVGSTVMEKKILDINLIHAIQSQSNSEKDLFNDLNYLLIKNNYTYSKIKYYMKNHFKKGRYDSTFIKYFKDVLQNMENKKLKEKLLKILFQKHVKMDINNFGKSLYLNQNDLKDLISNGMYIGAHGYNHYRYSNLSYKQQNKDIDITLKFLETIGSSKKDWIMCYPYGSYTPKTIGILKKKNCLAGLTINVGKNILQNTNFFELKRFDTNDFL
mgnify:CR=1 FL=1